MPFSKSLQGNKSAKNYAPCFNRIAFVVIPFNLINTEIKPVIIQIRILSPAGDCEQTFECKWPNYT